MKYTLKIILFALALYSCESKGKMDDVVIPDLEMEVINDILPLLIPNHPPCMVAPVEGEKPEDYEKRLEAFYTEVDSVGKKIEIISQLTKLDSNYIKVYKRLNEKKYVKHLLNAPNDNRTIDTSMINEIDAIQIVFVKEPRSTIGGLSDCSTLGQFDISRVGFNKDSTRASFTYSMDDGSCTGGKGGIIDTELKNGKWKAIDFEKE